MTRKPDSLASRLRLARTKREITQVQLAKASGMRQPDISKLERGDILQTTGIARIAATLRVSPAWLELGADPEPNWDALPAGLGEAHSMSLDAVTISPTRIAWGALMGKDLPRRFETVLPDDSMAPDARAGTVVSFSTELDAMPGDGVLVVDAAGNAYFRVMNQKTRGRWEATPKNEAYPTLDSEADGLRVVAVLEAVHQRWSDRR